MQAIFVTTLMVVAIALSGCSGSSLESDSNQQRPALLVNAGINQSVNEEAAVTLTADASGEGASFTYSWSVVPLLPLEQADASSPSVSFVAPVVTEPQVYTFTVLVSDGIGNQASDSVEVTVLPLNEVPSASISVLQPQIPAGFKYPAGVNMVLDGSSSIDIDAADGLDPIAAFRWQQTAGQDVLAGASLDGDSLAFVTPILESDSRLEFTLTVTDQEGAEDSASIAIDIFSASNTLPVVDAGKDHQVFTGESILLTGTATTSIPEANPLQARWLNDSQLSPQIDNTQALQTFAIAPSVASEQLVTFTLLVEDAFGNQVDDSLTVRIKPLPLAPLNDTGVILQATNSEVNNEHQASFPGQDGQRGQDVIHAHGLLEKAGRGSQGFDFTRLDAIGDEVDDTSLPWSCVRDNVTGLVWEVKTTNGGLHDSQHTYSWLLTENNGGDVGDINGVGTSCSLSNCNLRDYVDAVNAQGLCNFFDWRVPDHNELLSILHFGQTARPMIDTSNFVNTDQTQATPLWYWTSQVSVDGRGELGAQNAWAIDFATGNDNFLNKSTPAAVRLVRGGRE